MAGQWHYQHDGRRHGPVTGVDLKELAAAGKLLPTDLIWKEGMDKWVPARGLKGLFPEGAAKPVAAAPVPARVVRTGPPPLPPPLPDEESEEADDRPGPAKRRWPQRRFLLAGGAVVGLIGLIGVTLVWVMAFRGGGGLTGGSNERTASELMRELRACREQADREFGGKTFTVTGTVSQVVTDSIYLKGTDKEYGSLAYCRFGSGAVGDTTGYAAAVQQLKGVKTGQSVTVRCVFDKMTGGNTFFKNCQLADGPGESVVELVRRCNSLKDAFDKKYAGKRLRITGGVREKDKLLGEQWSLRFETDTEDDLTVWCRFKTKYDDRLQRLKKGEQVVIEAVFKGSAFADFERIEMLDGDLISPGGSGGKADDGSAVKGNKASGGRAASRGGDADGRTGSGEVTQNELDGMDFEQIMDRLGPPDESYHGTKKRNVKLAVWNSAGGSYITVTYIEPIDGVSPTLVLTKNVGRPREVVENLKRITANQ